MHQENLQTVMILIAIATPILGGLILVTSPSMARMAEQPPSPAIRRWGLILLLLGPLNLLAWLVLNRWLDGIGYRSVVGYVLAAIVFLALGWNSGMLQRRFGRRPPRNPGSHQPPDA